MFTRKRPKSTQDSIDSLNRTTRNLLIYGAVKNLKDAQALSRIRGNIEKIASGIFDHSFWNHVAKRPIDLVDMSFVGGQFERLSAGQGDTALVAQSAVGLWVAFQRVETIDDEHGNVRRLRLTPQGKEYLVQKYDSLPPMYLIVRDALSSPLAKLGWIVGVISSVIAIYQYLQPPESHEKDSAAEVRQANESG
jgi:hypothetical protein